MGLARSASLPSLLGTPRTASQAAQEAKVVKKQVSESPDLTRQTAGSTSRDPEPIPRQTNDCTAE